MPRPVDGMEVLFLDVGQGTGSCFVPPRRSFNRRGSTSEKKLGVSSEPCLKSCGVSVIEYAFVSHGDLDHISGHPLLTESCEEIEVRNLLLPVRGQEDEALSDLAELAKGQGTKVALLEAVENTFCGGIGVTVSIRESMISPRIRMRNRRC